MAYFDILSEHHKAIGLLIKRILSIQFRPCSSDCRNPLPGCLGNACATDKQLGQVIADDNFDFPNDMMQKIDAAYFAEDFFQNLKHNTWRSMVQLRPFGSESPLYMPIRWKRWICRAELFRRRNSRNFESDDLNADSNRDSIFQEHRLCYRNTRVEKIGLQN